jgi:hypothetical protein
MLRNYFLINIVLIIMLGFLSVKLYKVAAYSMGLPSGLAVDEVQKKEDQDMRLKARVPDKASFQIISGKDLFRPSRSAVSSIRTVAETSSKDHPKLFATIIQNGNSLALMEDPGTKKRKMYRIKDMIAGFLVSEIMQDKVVLMSGNDRIEVKLREDKGIKSRRPKAIRRQNTPAVQKSPRRRVVPAARRPARTTPPPRSMLDEDTADFKR